MVYMVSMKNIYPCTLGNRPMGSIKEYGSNTTSNRSRVDPPGLIRIGSKNATLSSQTRIPTKSPVCTNRDTIVNSNGTIPYRPTVTGKSSGRGIYLSPLFPRGRRNMTNFEEFSYLSCAYYTAVFLKSVLKIYTFACNSNSATYSEL